MSCIIYPLCHTKSTKPCILCSTAHLKPDLPHFKCSTATHVEKAMATHSSVLAWKIPWAEKPGGLTSRGRTESDTTEQLSSSSHTWLVALVLDSKALALQPHPHHGSLEWQFLLGGHCHALLWKPQALDHSPGSACAVTATHWCRQTCAPSQLFCSLANKDHVNSTSWGFPARTCKR